MTSDTNTVRVAIVHDEGTFLGFSVHVRDISLPPKIRPWLFPADFSPLPATSTMVCFTHGFPYCPPLYYPAPHPPPKVPPLNSLNQA